MSDDIYCPTHGKQLMANRTAVFCPDGVDRNVNRCTKCGELLLEKDEAVRAIVNKLENEMQCMCELDNWEPESVYEHSHVCPIYKVAKAEMAELERGKPNGSET